MHICGEAAGSLRIDIVLCNFLRVVVVTSNGVLRVAEVVRLHASNAAVGAGVSVDGNQEVGVGVVGDSDSRLQRDEIISSSRVNHLRSQSLLEQNAKTLGEIKGDVFFA